MMSAAGRSAEQALSYLHHGPRAPPDWAVRAYPLALGVEGSASVVLPRRPSAPGRSSPKPCARGFLAGASPDADDLSPPVAELLGFPPESVRGGAVRGGVCRQFVGQPCGRGSTAGERRGSGAA